MNATWATTRERRSARAPRPPLVERPSSRRTRVRFAPRTRESGTSPIPTPIAVDRRTTNSTTVPSMPIPDP